MLTILENLAAAMATIGLMLPTDFNVNPEQA